MWDVRDVGCSGCGMLEMWDVGCGMFAGMRDVDLQNASNFESFLKTGTTFAILKTEGKTPVMKERLNKSANCFEISFFRRNNIL